MKIRFWGFLALASSLVGLSASAAVLPVEGRVQINPTGRVRVRISHEGRDLVGTQRLGVGFVNYKGTTIELGQLELEVRVPLFQRDAEELAAARLEILRRIVEVQSGGYSLEKLPAHFRVRHVVASSYSPALSSLVPEALQGRGALGDGYAARLLIDTQARQIVGAEVERTERPLRPTSTAAVRAARRLLDSDFNVMLVGEIEAVVARLERAVGREAESSYAIMRAGLVADELRMALEPFQQTRTLIAQLGSTNPAENGGYWSNAARLETLGKLVRRLKIASRAATTRSCEARLLGGE